MVKPIDLTKLRKSVLNKIEGISTGFHDPKVWIHTNNYALNYFISNQFNRGIPLGQVTILAGESGAGKSFIAANVMRNALKQGIPVVVFDTENGLTKEWLQNTGIDINEYEKQGLFLRNQVALIDDLAKAVSEVMKDIKATYKGADLDERPKLLIVVDSLSMLLTRTDVSQFESGDVSKGDMGRQAKANKAFVKSCVVQFAEWDIGMLCTNHTYASQDMFNPDDNISGGQGPIFAASIVVAIKKMKLKEDEIGNKISEVKGIRAKVMVRKSRYTQPFQAVEIKIPYEGGIDEYSGLKDLFEKLGLLKKEGNKLKYTAIDGTEHKMFGSHFGRPEGKELLKLIMSEFDQKMGNETIDSGMDEIGELED